MAITLYNPKQEDLLKYLLGIDASDTGTQVGLYSSSGALACATSGLGLTELSVSGYSAQTLTYSNWSVSTTSCVSSATYNTALTFTLYASCTVYGWFFKRGDGTIYFAAPFSSGSIPIGSAGGDIVLTPKITMGACS